MTPPSRRWPTEGFLRRALLGALLGFVAVWMGSPARAGTGFLDPDLAFQLEARALDDHRIELDYRIAPGYYLYRERFKFESTAVQGAVEIPPGQVKYDSALERQVETYHDQVRVVLPFTAGAPEFRLKATHQGCAEQGLCYPPATRIIEVRLKGLGAAIDEARLLPKSDELFRTQSTMPPQAAAATPSGSSDSSDESRLAAMLRQGRWWAIVPAFLLAGLLLSLTPCVLPMLPILSALIVGRGEPVSRGRGFLLAAAYSLGMALLYTGLGIAAGLAGEGLAAWLQAPWVLLSFAGLLVVLSLSMFGVYELQLPAGLRDRLSSRAGRLRGGQVAGVFAMGGLSALIVSPCVAAPLAGALLYISQTRDAWLGGTALFMLALGMSVPLLAIGASAGGWLPRGGAWMVRIKQLFGVVLVGMAFYIAWPVIHSVWPASNSPQAAGLRFEAVSNVADLERRVRAAGRPVMLDFYADWCVACKEMESRTFTDGQVRARLSKALLLRADVTANSADDRALLRKFQLFGPPGLIFYDAQGREMPQPRVIGYQDGERFLRTLDDAGWPGR